MLAHGGSAEPSLTLQLSTDQPHILVGQAVRAVLSWSSTESISVAPSAAILLVNDGRGFVEHNETAISTASSVPVAFQLGPGRPLRTAHVVGVTGGRFCGDHLCDVHLVFSRQGRYQLVARYGAVESNVVKLDVLDPQGHDREFFERHLSQRPELLTEWPIAVDTENVRRLCRQYPESPYLDLSRLRLARHDVAAAGGGAQSVERAIRRLLKEPGCGAFEEDRLESLAESAANAGLVALSRKLYRRLLMRFPAGPGASAARAALGIGDVSHN
jgi:hypothetical protein